MVLWLFAGLCARGAGFVLVKVVASVVYLGVLRFSPVNFFPPLLRACFMLS